MQFTNVVIESIAYHLPETKWSSAYLEAQLAPLYERLGLANGRLELMTGIIERRFYDTNYKPSIIAAAAGQKLLSVSQVSRKAVDLLIHAAVCRDRLEPCTAIYVHDKLGLSKHTQVIDVSNACLGVLNAIMLAAGMIQAGYIKTAMIVAGEHGRPLIEQTLEALNQKHITRQSLKPYFANLTIGSGGCALMLTHASMVSKPSLHLIAAASETDSSANQLCKGDHTSTQTLEMQTDSEQLLAVGLEVASRAWTQFETATGWRSDTIHKLICHQVGKRHQTQLYQKLGLDLSKDFSTYQYLGNIGSVSLPLTLSKALEHGHVQLSDTIALLGIGSGISSLMLGLHYR